MAAVSSSGGRAVVASTSGERWPFDDDRVATIGPSCDGQSPVERVTSTNG